MAENAGQESVSHKWDVIDNDEVKAFQARGMSLEDALRAAARAWLRRNPKLSRRAVAQQPDEQQQFQPQEDQFQGQDEQFQARDDQFEQDQPEAQAGAEGEDVTVH
ncbi:MAG TPA: hypothetical protein VK447_03025 [Myxococcaceae bacterium]|nr:hypothetical protein [Myxococcaceae bacterium]